MDYYVIIGMVFASIVAIFGFTSSIKKSVKDEQSVLTEIKICLQKLNDEISVINKISQTRDKTLEKHEKTIEDLDERVTKVEYKQSGYDVEIKNLKEKIKG